MKTWQLIAWVAVVAICSIAGAGFFFHPWSWQRLEAFVDGTALGFVIAVARHIHWLRRDTEARTAEMQALQALARPRRWRPPAERFTPPAGAEPRGRLQ
jgi:hypothetical protein